jgi:hypothetical protein
LSVFIPDSFSPPGTYLFSLRRFFAWHLEFRLLSDTETKSI